MATLLVLAAGPLQLPAITTARRMGLRVVAADGDRDAPGLALADVAHVINILDPEACLDIARREKIDGVIHICSEVSMFSMGRINEELGLAGIDSATAIRATNKEEMRRAFEAGGAPSPRSIGVTTEDEALRALQAIGGPVIFKPSRNSGSRGITRLGEDVSPEQAAAALRYAIEESRDRSALVEEYVEGPEFSVEILAFGGRNEVLAVTDKVTTGAPHFVETGHSQPTREPPDARAAIAEAAVQGVRALGIDWAAAHAEVKLSPRGPFLIEIGARLGGDFITTELVPRSTGIDMVEGAINLALGRQPDLEPRHAPRGAAIRYLTPPPGRALAVKGVDEARRMPGVKVVEVDVGVGDTVPEVKSSLTRVGYVIAEGAGADEAVANAEAARDAIVIETAGEPAP
ncbi:MAG: ATP-grasp domain-containing protein [Phycisphaerae bacterium]